MDREVQCHPKMYKWKQVQRLIPTCLFYNVVQSNSHTIKTNWLPYGPYSTHMRVVMHPEITNVPNILELNNKYLLISSVICANIK